ncbi:hypothetical protein P0R31_36935 [Bradyrhizobium yuanmingense]|uniref:hypothetical protein n=1 Tax=Bradyrhizobium yuanmingense TaxID=108015 RepID=UPI0023BA254E|nr:hypothetical protein [Bradyrhizobium yuanmingense]MDF0522824.1 hypothetical protein [Bradyrhizobium yuanmingense]
MLNLRVGVIAIALCFAGCAIHPLPEDFSGVPTDVIVQQNRCETRQAIIDSALGWLTSEGNLHEGRVDLASHQVGLQFLRGRPIQQFRPELFRGRVRHIVQLFFDTGVAYSFQLQMIENNDVSAGGNLVWPPPPFPRLDAGLSAAIARQRGNLRTFASTDTFSSLIKLPDDYCDGRLVEKNYLYPIAGKIGSKKLVQDFINLSLFQNLGGGPPTLSDQLEFETILSASTTPKLTFAPVRSGLGVADVSFTGGVKRTDRHKLTMALAVAGPGARLLSEVRNQVFYTPLVSARPKTSSEAAAVEAVNQVLTLQLFRPTINVTF